MAAFGSSGADPYSSWGGGNGAYANASVGGGSIGAPAGFVGGGGGGGGGGGMGGGASSYTGVIGGILGTGVGALEGSYLGAPGVAKPMPWNPTLLDLGSAFKDYSGMFNQDFSQGAAMASKTNNFNLNEAMKQYTAMQPQFQNLQKQIGDNALSYSKGQLPSDVVSSIGRAATSQGIQNGFAGGGGPAGTSFGTNSAATSLDLRNLGMSSLDLSQMGTQLGMQVNAQAKALSPVLASPTDFLPSFSTALGVDESNNQLTNSASLSNTAAMNQYNQDVLNAQYTKKLNLVNEMMQGASIGSSMCVVARHVFGAENPEWKAFRKWLVFEAPEWFFNLYLNNGDRFVAWMKRSRFGGVMKALLKPVMRSVIK